MINAITVTEVERIVRLVEPDLAASLPDEFVTSICKASIKGSKEEDILQEEITEGDSFDFADIISRILEIAGVIVSCYEIHLRIKELRIEHSSKERILSELPTEKKRLEGAEQAAEEIAKL